MDPALERYVEAIERHLGQRRGRTVTLSPKDFELARSWHGAGVSVDAVTSGIDRVIAQGGEPTSLAFCRRAVEAGGCGSERR